MPGQGECDDPAPFLLGTAPPDHPGGGAGSLLGHLVRAICSALVAAQRGS